MLKLSELAQLGRELRQDDWTELGPPYDFGATRRAHPWSWVRVGREKPDNGEGRY